jgi:TetR/AcrR family transcriptional regulator
MVTPARREAMETLLDAAERLLVEVGYAGITTRRLAQEAGVNHGLVHYYFGSMEEVFLQVLERFTDRLIERQQAMYAAPVSFLDKWRAAMRYLDEDQAAGYPKIWFELRAMAWNRPELRERVAKVHDRWVEVLVPAFAEGMAAYGLDAERFPVRAVVALVTTFNQGIEVERLSGVDSGHRELLAAIDAWIESLERRKQEG